MKSNKLSLPIVALVWGIYVIGPDSFHIVIDDFIIGLIGAANVLRMMKSSDDNPRLYD